MPSYRNLRLRDNYIVSCDMRNKHPRWVLDRVPHIENFGPDIVSDDDSYLFQPDPSIPVGSRSDNSDYANSPYDRGHLSPARQHRYQPNFEWFRQSYWLSNIAPFVRDLNRECSPWWRLERYVYSFLPKRIRNVYVVTGTMYHPGERDYNRIERVRELTG